MDQPSTAPVPGGRPAAASRAPLVYERLLPSLPLCVSRVRMELDAALALLDVAGLRRADVALVVTEAATNVVLHAYRTGAAGPLYAAARLSGRTLEVTVCDCGGGHAGAGDSGGAGFGTPLMAALSDDLWVGTDPGGTCVQATFREATAARPAGAGNGAARAQQRGETLREYLRVVAAVSAALHEDTQALSAQAKLLMARSEQLAAERPRRR